VHDLNSEIAMQACSVPNPTETTGLSSQGPLWLSLSRESLYTLWRESLLIMSPTLLKQLAVMAGWLANY